MSTLSTLRTRLSSELGDSETINKTADQRDQAINDALTQIYEYRNWRELYVNTTTQNVDGIFNIPRNQEKSSALWFGKNQAYLWSNDFVSQTDFLADMPNTATVTEVNGIQVLKVDESNENRGHDVKNTTGTDLIGINDVAAREQVGQTFVADADALEGVLLKLSTVGSPTGTLTVDILNTAAGLPTGAALATTTIDIAEITEDEEYFWGKFQDTLSVTTGDTYAITVTTSYATSGTDYVQWTYSTTSQIDGSQVLFDGVVWSLGTGDQVFVLCSDYWNQQYVKKFVPLTQSTDDSGLPSKFDQAIAKMAAGIILETKMQDEKAIRKFYGLGGNARVPSQNSAFGLLDLIWTQTRYNSTRPKRRMKSVYEKRAQYNGADYYPYYYSR